MVSQKTDGFLSNVKPIDLVKITMIICSIIFAVTFFVYEMQGLPPRVSKLEQDLPTTREQLRSEMNELKSQIDKSDTKTNIILEDVKIIKGILMKQEGK